MSLLIELIDLNEDKNYGMIQQTIYQFVISKMNLGRIKEDALELSRSTDEFWVPQFDDLHRGLEKSWELDEVLEDLSYTIHEISAVISAYYKNAMNHPPGYKPVKINLIEPDSLTDGELKKLITKISPEFIKKSEEASRKRLEDEKKVKAEAVKSVTDNRISDVVEFIKKNDYRGWDSYLKSLKKTKRPDDFLSKKMLPLIAEIRKLETAEDLRNFFKTRCTPQEFIKEVCENMFNLNIGKKNGAVERSTLSIIAGDARLSKKLYALLP